ncbi:hypothetical protein VB773_20895 [Haloarculaceae archaeon H-GB2-1]|nr:hypothetical protein [Haloarculaceae archaeon H-GB2-1]
MLDELTTVVFPAIEFDRSEGVIYDDEELLLVETLMGVTGTAVGGGAETYGDYVNPEPAVDGPFFADGPSGETLREEIKDLDIEELTVRVNRGAARILTRAKPTIEFEHPAMLAIDMTYIAYYAQRDELVRMQRARDHANPSGVRRSGVSRCRRGRCTGRARPVLRDSSQAR